MIDSFKCGAQESSQSDRPTDELAEQDDEQDDEQTKIETKKRAFVFSTNMRSVLSA